MMIEERKRFFTSVIISMVVGATTAMSVGIFTHMYRVNNSTKEAIHYVEQLESQNYELMEEIIKLRDRLIVIEKDVGQNRNLIETFDTNLKFQAEVVKSLLPKEKSGGE